MADPLKIAREYRPSMNSEVLHSWAAEAAALIASQAEEIARIKAAALTHIDEMTVIQRRAIITEHRALAAEAALAEAVAERDAAINLICRVEPHIDAIVCYASTMGEHEPNRIAHEVRAIRARTLTEKETNRD